MEGKVIRQKSSTADNLDEMLLASFLNDEYKELQDDVRESIYGLKDSDNEEKCTLDEIIEENILGLPNLQDESKIVDIKNDNRSHNKMESEKTVSEETKCPNTSIIHEVKKNFICSSEVITNASMQNSKQILEGELHAGESILRKRNVEVLETMMARTEKQYILSTETLPNDKEVYHDSHYTKGLSNTEDDKLINNKTEHLENKDIIKFNEIPWTNGSIHIKDSNTTEREREIPIQSYADDCIERESSLMCKKDFVMSIKICFIIIMFLCLLYYFLIQKRLNFL